MLLSHQRVRAEGAIPQRFIMFLHGILGRGENWKGFARRLVAARPDWGAVLVDLPLHGDSLRGPWGHTLEAATAEVGRLIEAIDGAECVAGHSFGGKVALGLLAKRELDLRGLWVLDASPTARGARPDADQTTRVFATLRQLPGRFADRRSFVAQLQERGVSEALARWLAKNLARADDGLCFQLDLDAIEALIADYDRIDLWQVVESPPAGIELRFVLGGQGEIVSSADRERLDALAQRGSLRLDVLPDAGHWLHVDDPEGLLALFRDGLP